MAIRSTNFLVFLATIFTCVAADGNAIQSYLRSTTNQQESGVDKKEFKKEANQLDRELQSSNINIVGNDGYPSSSFPLGLCEGDCDSSTDCEGNLICFQRDGYDSVPGCSGGSSLSSNEDVCVHPSALGLTGGPPPSAGQPNGDLGSSPPFRMKLYWEDGYEWQGEDFERKWCMRCRSSSCGRSETDRGDVVIVDCDDDYPNYFEFLQLENGEVQIQVNGYSTCLQRDDGGVYLRTCDSSEDDQRWIASSGSFNQGSKFQISPMSNPSLCMSQTHHPKFGETVYLYSCSSAARADTSEWNMY